MDRASASGAEGCKYPLVEVLQEVLARDYVKNDKERFAAAKAKGDKTAKATTKKEAKSKVRSFIQKIHHYRDTYLEGIKIDNDKLIPIHGYLADHQDKAYIPSEHVAIYDEAHVLGRVMNLHGS